MLAGPPEPAEAPGVFLADAQLGGSELSWSLAGDPHARAS